MRQEGLTVLISHPLFFQALHLKRLVLIIGAWDILCTWSAGGRGARWWVRGEGGAGGWEEGGRGES